MHLCLFSFLEIIDDLANLVENTDEKLRTETRRVNMVDRKSTSCGERAVAVVLPLESLMDLPCSISHVCLITAGICLLL